MDVDAEIDDIPHYLNRLRVLTEEALPEKRTRFLEYLNRSSDQGVTQLLAGIAEEVDAIEQRIRELNQTLVKVDFRSGRYALCPTGASRPLYGTVILDEAFSKSSPSAASRIIDALRIFCLHPIFVTPNKEIGLLKQHTRKVICVQRPGKESSLASITWEKLDELASRK